MKYNPYMGEPEPAQITLDEYAESWIDMVPHVGQLTALAAQAKVIVEFGLRGGVSTWAMLMGLRPNGRLYGVDIDPNALIARVVRADPRFHFIVGNSIEVPLPSRADLVMIDSSHEYEQTVEELKVAARMEPSFIVLHDYLYREDGCRVKEAVDGFHSFGPYKLEVVHPSPWGLAVMVPK